MKYTACLAVLGLLSQAAWGQRAGGNGMGGHRGGGGNHSASPGGGYRRGGIPAAPATAPAPARVTGAQTYTPNTYGSPLGYGNVVFPGTGHMPGTYSPFSIVDPTFGARLGYTVSGFPYPYGYSSGYYGSGYGYGRRGPVVVPYGVPVYAPYYEDPYAAAPPPAPPPAPVIIYIVPGPPSTAVVTTAPQQAQNGVVTYVVPPRNGEATESTAPRLYLIALKNSSIYSAAEYWVEDDTLHYVTAHGVHNQVSIDQLDMELTKRLNRERGLDFRLDQ